MYLFFQLFFFTEVLKFHPLDPTDLFQCPNKTIFRGISIIRNISGLIDVGVMCCSPKVKWFNFVETLVFLDFYENCPTNN